MSISVFFILAVIVMVVIVLIVTRSATGGGSFGPRQACGQCGTPNPSSATYCRKCGKPLR